MLGSAIPDSQFLRIEGVAEREPCFRGNPDDSQNPLMSLTLGWRTVLEGR